MATVSTTPTPPAMESIDQFVQWATETAQVKGPKVVDWLYTEVPEVVEQFLMWSFAESFIGFLACFFFIFVYPFIFYKVAKHFYIKFEVNKEHDESFFWIPTAFIGGVTILVTQLCSWDSINLNWLKVWLAPKVYLLETFSNVIK
jgi:hypothetical protein